MPDSLRSLIVIFALATAVFAIASRPACESAMTRADFQFRRNIWTGITLIAFLANNYWLYVIASGMLLAYAARRDKNPIALFFFVLFAAPPIPNEIGGGGSFTYLFAIDYRRLLGLVVLLPAALALRNERHGRRPGSISADKWVLAYLIADFIIFAPQTTITNSVRAKMLYPALGVFLPYFVASRSLRTQAAFNDAIMAYTVAAMVLSAVACFEFAKHWLLYEALEGAWGVKWNMGGYLRRAGDLRASGSTGQAIALGFAIALGIGFLIYLRPLVSRPGIWRMGIVLMAGGLFATLSRGPWLGAAVMLTVFAASGRNGVKQIGKLVLVGVLAIPLIAISPLGGYLPWVGTVEQNTVDFRELLLRNAITVILRNPLTGSQDFKEADEMQELAMGSGFIDIVNTYVGIGLRSGLVVLGLFVASFGSAIAGTFRSMRAIRAESEELGRLGQCLLSLLISIMFMIFTVSSISIVPVIYWTIIGMSAAYIGLVRNSVAPRT